MDWKATFLAKPSISIRKGIAFGYNEPQEFTSTLVLTALSGKFIDIRFPLEIAGHHPTKDQPLTSYPAFWAFSGTSQTTFYGVKNNVESGFPYTAHTVFTHDIDTKGPGITDEGDCFLLPNGDVMEVGIWHETKQLYKEYWTEPQSPAGQSLLKTPVVVMETVKAVSGRGIVIRVGDYIQGIFEHKEDTPGERVLVSRAVRQRHRDLISDDGSQRLERDLWVVDDRSNTFDDGDDKTIPSLEVASNATPLGWEIQCKGNTWRVTELEHC